MCCTEAGQTGPEQYAPRPAPRVQRPAPRVQRPAPRARAAREKTTPPTSYFSEYTGA